MRSFDYLIIGSGCSAAMSAQTLVDAGKDVTVLDVGAQNPQYDSQVPNKDFLTIRKTDPEQYRYFIGDKGSGLVWGDIGKGAQITPSRKHMLQFVDTYLRVKSSSFSPVESLGYGGLGIGWGLQCWEYSDADLEATGMNTLRMREAYETVAQRIGISGVRDDAAQYTLANLRTLQESPRMDRNHQLIYDKYAAHKQRFNKQGFYLGRTPLALLSKNLHGRKKYDYRSMDYYDDNGHSAWRPWMTIDDLRKRDNFTYIGGYLVTHFRERRGVTEVHCLDVADNSPVTFTCRTLILATGALGSARIALRSMADKKVRLPLLCNPYTYVPCLQPSLVGKAAEAEKLGFAQLSLFLDKNQDDFDTSIASLYSYQSLMLFRIIRQAPLNFRDARLLMRYFMSGLEIMGVHHPDTRSDTKYVELTKNKTSPTGDVLRARYELSAADKARFSARERVFIAAMRRMGTFALKRMNPGYGSSIHYAGTLPWSEADEPFTLDTSGRLHGTRRVFVADSSGFNYLPARGLTFSLLANAHLTAENVLTDG
jgi:choline dehydrogenase-like flavoprotein